jgi:hypothetical protein
MIGNGVTSIGDYAFAYCPSLIGVYFEGSAPTADSTVFDEDNNATVYYVPGSTGWSSTFAGLPAMPTTPPAQFSYMTNAVAITITITGYTGTDTVVTLPPIINNLPVTSIGDWAFAYNSNLTSVTIPDSVTSIGSNVFFLCFNLAGVTIPNSVTNIGGAAFEDCLSLASVTIPGSVTSIGQEAFCQCGSLAGVTIPDTVTSIGQEAFCQCTSLASVTIPNSVTSIADYAFAACFGLTSVFFEGNAPTADSTVFAYENNPTVYYMPGATGWSSTFAGLPALPTTPQAQFGYTTSDGAITLTGYTGSGGAVVIPPIINNQPVTSIGGNAFFQCSNLTSVTIPGSVTSIGEDAFYSCANLTNATIANGVTSIGYEAFCQCTGLTSVTIPGSVTSIAEGAFHDCASLTSVYFTGNAPSADTTVFSSDNDVTIYYLPGATGWSNPFAGVPAVLWTPLIQASSVGVGVQNNQFGFNINWASGQVILVEACTNLASPVWTQLRIVPLTNSSFYFSDPQWTNYPCRFYLISSP